MDWPAVSNSSFWQEIRTPIDKKSDHNQYDRHWLINGYNVEKLPNFPSRKNNQFKMRDIKFVKNQFVSRRVYIHANDLTVVSRVLNGL